MPPLAIKIGSKIRQNSGVCISFLMENENIGRTLFSSLVFEMVGEEMKERKQVDVKIVGEKSESEKELLEELREMVRNFQYHSLVDFEAHLSNVSQDWRNQELFTANKK